jgi:hypothetical protein
MGRGSADVAAAGTDALDTARVGYQFLSTIRF